MTPRRLVLICLFALVVCQSAMAAGWCNEALSKEAGTATECHGQPLDASDADGACPGAEGSADLGKFPVMAAAAAGHDFRVDGAPRRTGMAPTARHARPRDGPALDALCRLLI